MVNKLRLLKAAVFQHFWSWTGVAQQACRGRLSRDDGGRKQSGYRRSVQQFQCSMAVLELLARATEAWVVAAGNEHLVNRSSRIALAAHAVVGTMPAYAATKGAIGTLVKHFASMLGTDGIRVKCRRSRCRRNRHGELHQNGRRPGLH